MQPSRSMLKHASVTNFHLLLRGFTFSLWHSLYCEKHHSFRIEPLGTDEVLVHSSPSTRWCALTPHLVAALPSTPSALPLLLYPTLLTDDPLLEAWLYFMGTANCLRVAGRNHCNRSERILYSSHDPLNPC